MRGSSPCGSEASSVRSDSPGLRPMSGVGSTAQQMPTLLTSRPHSASNASVPVRYTIPVVHQSSHGVQQPQQQQLQFAVDFGGRLLQAGGLAQGVGSASGQYGHFPPPSAAVAPESRTIHISRSASRLGASASNQLGMMSQRQQQLQQQQQHYQLANDYDFQSQSGRLSVPTVQSSVTNSNSYNSAVRQGTTGISIEFDANALRLEQARRLLAVQQQRVPLTPPQLSAAQRQALLQMRPAPATVYSVRQPPIVQQQVYSRPVAMTATEPATAATSLHQQQQQQQGWTNNSANNVNIRQQDGTTIYIDSRTIFGELGLLKNQSEDGMVPLQVLWTAVEQPPTDSSSCNSKLHSPSTSTNSDANDWDSIDRLPPPYPSGKLESSINEDNATTSSEQAESVTDSGVGDGLGQAEIFEPLSSELQDTLVLHDSGKDLKSLDDSGLHTLGSERSVDEDVVASGREKYICQSPKPQRKPNAEELDKQRSSFNVRHYPAEAFKFYIEQHYDNLFRQQEQREERRSKLEQEMRHVGMTEETKPQLRLLLQQKESNYNRLKRVKLNKDMFIRIKTLGVGAFGEVLLVQKRDTRQLFAMKILRWNDVLRRNQIAHVKAERDILAEADNEWVVKLYWSFRDDDCLYFILEYIPGGDLMGLLIRLEIFSEELARFYIAELVAAIESVHSLDFIHRDIKPDNVLIDKQGHIKLTDFGLCTGLRWTHSSKAYTRG